MLNQIIQRAFGCADTHINYEKMREYKVFSQVEKHYLMSLTTLKVI